MSATDPSAKPPIPPPEIEEKDQIRWIKEQLPESYVVVVLLMIPINVLPMIFSFYFPNPVTLGIWGLWTLVVCIIGGYFHSYCEYLVGYEVRKCKTPFRCVLFVSCQLGLYLSSCYYLWLNGPV